MRCWRKALYLVPIIGCIAALGVSMKSETNETEKPEENIAKAIYTEEYQTAVEERLEEEKSTGIYTEKAMLIKENPYGTNNLSLYVYFETEEAVKVSYTVSVPDETIEDFSKTPVGECGYGTEHEFQVIGLVPEQKNTITFTLQGQDGSEETYTCIKEIGAAEGDEEIRLEKTEMEEKAEEISDGLYVILGNDSDDRDYMYYYDNSGVLRGEVPLIGYRSHRLLFQNNLMYYSISEHKIAAVNNLGKVERIYSTGDYSLHHDYVFDDDGNLIVLATEDESESVEDQIIRINTETGEVKCVLDLGELLPDYKEDCVENEDGELDWAHLNTVQWIVNQKILLSSRETSTIIMISDLYNSPKIDYMIGEESFWEGTGYETLLLQKDESEGAFTNTGGQHSVTWQEEDGLGEGEYYLYMFNNNFGVSVSNPDYDWSEIEGMETSMQSGEKSYFYKYKIDENKNEYKLIQSFEVPFSAYVSSAQEYEGNIIIDSGMKGIFGEYASDGSLLCQFKMKLSDEYIYRVYKYNFEGYYFAD